MHLFMLRRMVMLHISRAQHVPLQVASVGLPARASKPTEPPSEWLSSRSWSVSAFCMKPGFSLCRKVVQRVDEPGRHRYDGVLPAPGPCT